MVINEMNDSFFAGLKRMREMHTYFITLLEHGGIGLFYEFYHDKTLKELLTTRGSVLCGNKNYILVFIILLFSL